MSDTEIQPDHIWNSEKKESLKEFILAKSKGQSEERILKNKLLAVKYKIEDYIRDGNNEELEVHHFINMYLNILNITQKKLAQFLEMEHSNFHKYLTGKRKINANLALKFSYLFHIEPEYWYRIQIKNEINREKKDKSGIQDYRKYTIQNLVNS